MRNLIFRTERSSHREKIPPKNRTERSSWSPRGVAPCSCSGGRTVNFLSASCPPGAGYLPCNVGADFSTVCRKNRSTNLPKTLSRKKLLGNHPRKRAHNRENPMRAAPSPSLGPTSTPLTQRHCSPPSAGPSASLGAGCLCGQAAANHEKTLHHPFKQLGFAARQRSQ